MKVSFIIPVYNHLDLTRACLQSLIAKVERFDHALRLGSLSPQNYVLHNSSQIPRSTEAEFQLASHSDQFRSILL